MKKLIILFIMSMVSLCAYAQFRPNYNMPEYMIPAEYAIALNHTEEITINDFPKNYSGQIDLEVSYRGTYIKVYKLNVTETFNFEFFTTSSKSGFEFYFAGDNPKTILGYATAHAVFAYPDNQSLQQYGTVAVYAPIYLLLWGSARLPEEELPYYSIQFSKNNPSPTITWQQEETATGYRIDIYYENGEVITSLNFDASGNYVGIVQKSLSLKTTEPFSFDANTLGLKENTTFYYTITALTEDGETQLKEGVFKTGEKTEPVRVETISVPAVLVAYYNLLGQKLNEEPQKGMYIVQYSNGSTEKRVR